MTEPAALSGSLSGTVRTTGQGESNGLHPAFIVLGDSLLAVTDELGVYSIPAIGNGTYALICSSPGRRDTTAQVIIRSGESTTFDFTLSPDSTRVKVRGEFQDMDLFQARLSSDASLAGWDDLQVFDGVTGATLQEMTLNYAVPDRQVFLGDSLMALADGFAQYWFTAPCGTYPLTGSCEGYRSATRIIKIQPGMRNIVNFFLTREK